MYELDLLLNGWYDIKPNQPTIAGQDFFNFRDHVTTSSSAPLQSFQDYK